MVEVLDTIHCFKLAQGLHGVDVLLVRGSFDPISLAIILLLSLHQRFLLRCLHPPGNGGHIEGLHTFVLLVLGGGDVRRLYSGYHGVHQILCSLDEGHGAVQLFM